MTGRYVCVHGHFYQPPREDPRTGRIERQPSAHPYPDWNERITAECYRPNGAARVLDARGATARTVNNYARISFNFGPTLLSWLERHADDVYRSILDADRQGSGALAQAYNHMILPLATPRDRRCQVVWGVRDFEHRFGRRPAGMWLPETAVDRATLEALVDAGLRFTILAPHQARRVRASGASDWRTVDERTLDTTVAYEQRLASGRSIALFFYHAPVARAVAFEGVLRDGRVFAARLAGILPGADDAPHLAHIATDGESYGHHHKFGEMALATALEHLAARGDVELTHFDAFLARHPVRHEVEIAEATSWSCPHGVARWHEDCGCGTAAAKAPPWRAPLREALDWLRHRLALAYEAATAPLVRDPWQAREESIDLVLGRPGFFERHARTALGPAERERLVGLLDMQREALLMFTSCGWFFEDPARLETIQVLRHAGRAIELARQWLGLDAEPEFLRRLAAARSARANRGSCRDLYERHVTRREPAESDTATPADPSA